MSSVHASSSTVTLRGTLAVEASTGRHSTGHAPRNTSGCVWGCGSPAHSRESASGTLLKHDCKRREICRENSNTDAAVYTHVAGFLLGIFVKGDKCWVPTPKVNKLQSPKLRLTQSLLVATFTQNFMRFRCTVMEKCHQNFPPHSSVCDDRYHACTFAWYKLCALFTPH